MEKIKTSFEIEKILYEKFIKLLDSKCVNRTKLITKLIQDWVKENDK